MTLASEPTSVLQDNELLIQRTFDAPPELVFRVWTRPEHLARWWGPKDFTPVAFEQDFRPGGAYRAGIRAPSGSETWMAGVYREIVPERRIVMTFQWEGGASDLGESLITVTFEATPTGGTAFSFHQAPFPTVESRDSHVGGWSGLLDNLASYLATVARS